MLDDIGINMELNILDYPVYSSISRARNYGPYEILYTTDSGNGTYLKFLDFRGPNSYNPSYINDPPGSDPVIEAAYQSLAQYYDTFVTDETPMLATHKNLMPYLLEQAYCIPSPSANYWCLWWPWVKNYYGTYACGYYNYANTVKYRWIDQDLKREMGY